MAYETIKKVITSVLFLVVPAMAKDLYKTVVVPEEQAASVRAMGTLLRTPANDIISSAQTDIQIQPPTALSDGTASTYILGVMIEKIR